MERLVRSHLIYTGRKGLNNIISQIEDYVKLIDARLSSCVGELDVPEKKIYQAMRYSLLAGGKRIRPVLTLSVNDMFGGDIEAALPFACAVELIHTYSLIHDDLPALDNDDYRRGRKTNHKVFGESMAILAGDALLNKAFEIMIDSLKPDVKLADKIKAMREVASASGANGMIGGQVVDIESEGCEVVGDILKYMHLKKTGCLIKASAKVGAIIAGMGEQDINRIDNYAQNLGLAFQIKDDILSEVGNEARMGKSVGNDRKNRKSTYVTILGLDEAYRLLNLTTRDAVESLSSYGEKADFLIGLAEYLLKREY